MSFGLGKLGRLGRLGVASGRGTGGGGTGAELTYGSGKKFPIWNSMAGTDKIKSFKLSGYTVQEGMPTPEAPVPLLSVGDGGLKLCISGSETGIALQVVDFGDIVLRSLPNGVCDSIEWDGKNWKHVQRIKYYKYDDKRNLARYSTGSAENTDIYFISAIEGVSTANMWQYNLSNVFVTKNVYVDLHIGECSFNNGLIYFGVDNTLYTTVDEVKNWLINIGASFVYELAEPVTTILEGIPAPQMFDEVTYFGTPAALVKPYMMCECKVKKALKYQGEIIGQYYFGGNKSNETEHRIADISGNGNDLTPHGFAWTRESGWNQGGIYGDGIDDLITVTKSIDIKDVLISTSDMSRVVANGIKYILSAYIYQTGNLIGLIINNYDHILSVNNNTATATPNNVLAVLMNHFRLKFISEGLTRNINLFNVHGTGSGDNKAKGMIHECLLFSSELTDEEFTNNIQLSKQRNGVDGDINIIPEPEVYYDFSLYNNTDFPTTIENLATDKSKALQLFNFAGTEESGFFEGALVSDGVDDYAIIQNQTEGFKTVFIECIPMKINNNLYTQGRFSQTYHFTIYNYQTSIAYNWQNEGGETYIDGELNESTICRNLLNKRQIITIVNGDVNSENSYTPIFFCSYNLQEGFMSAKTFKFLGFKEALTAEQIKLVIDKYFK